MGSPVMNFLAHDHVLPPSSPPLARVGSALPDLWPWLPQRVLPLHVLSRLRASPDPRDAQLVAGIASHMHADAVFHRHPEFRRRMELVSPHLRQTWPRLRHVSLAAHVLVEMVLDRWLLQQQPSRVEDYYAAFSTANRQLACAHTTSNRDQQEHLGSLLDRFVSSSFLSHYRHPSGLAARFARTIERTSFAPTGSEPLPALARLVQQATAWLGPGSRELLDEVAQEAERRRRARDPSSPL